MERTTRKEFEEGLKLIKKIIMNTAKKYQIEVDRLILFGSRARGNYKEYSDWDIMIVTKKEYNREKTFEFIRACTRAVLPEDVHIIVVGKDHFEKYKDVYGSIAGMSNLEGVIV